MSPSETPLAMAIQRMLPQSALRPAPSDWATRMTVPASSPNPITIIMICGANPIAR